MHRNAIAFTGAAADCTAQIVDGIAERGYAIVADFLPHATVAALRDRAGAAFTAQRMRPAAVGRAVTRVHDAAQRGDAILWLDAAASDPAERTLLATLEALRLRVNETLCLGLFDFEGHYARYPEGASYVRHRDRFRDQDTRTLSFVLYLNDRWAATAGGALRLHLDDATTVDVLPEGGTVVAFLSDRFEHEVRPATCPRWSFTGWFRRRPA